MKLWILTAALVLTPMSASLAADPPGTKPAGRSSVPAVQTPRPAGTLAFAGIQGDGPGGKVEALSISGSCEQAAAPAAGSAAVTSPRDAASGLPTGKRQHKPFVITKSVDKASPVLMQAAASGKHFPTVVIEHAGSKVELTNVLIGMIKAGPSAVNKPTESVELNFESCAKR